MIKLILGILWLVLFIWALVDIIGTRKELWWKAVWIIACLIFPVVGVICYLIFGRMAAKNSNPPSSNQS